MAPRRPGGYNDEQLTFDSLWAEPERRAMNKYGRHRDEPLAEDRPGALRRRSRTRRRSSPSWGRGRRARFSSSRTRWRDRPPGGELLEKVGRLNMARLAAEEQVLREMLLIPSREHARRSRRDRPGPGVHAGSEPGDARDGEDEPEPTEVRARLAGGPGALGRRARVRRTSRRCTSCARLEHEQRPASVSEQRAAGARGAAGVRCPSSLTSSARSGRSAREQLRGLLDERRVRGRAAHDDQRALHRPAIAAAMWRAGAASSASSGGRVLEPGCGAGVFLGLAPEARELTGVELDPTTAAIAAALYPHADDPRRVVRRHAAARRLLRSWRSGTCRSPTCGCTTRVTTAASTACTTTSSSSRSRSTATGRAGRRAHQPLHAGRRQPRRAPGDRQLADLLGAVRLPTGAHRRAAGTDALTDLLIFRRREPQRRRARPSGTTRRSTSTAAACGSTATSLEHPERVLGELALGHGMYGAETLQVRPRDV